MQNPRDNEGEWTQVNRNNRNRSGNNGVVTNGTRNNPQRNTVNSSPRNTTNFTGNRGGFTRGSSRDEPRRDGSNQTNRDRSFNSSRGGYGSNSSGRGGTQKHNQTRDHDGSSRPPQRESQALVRQTIKAGQEIKAMIKTSEGKLVYSDFANLATQSLGEYRQIYFILNCIKFSDRFPAYIGILKTAIVQGTWPHHVKESLSTGFTPLQAINWLDHDFDQDIVTQLYEVCHMASCNPFSKNKKDTDGEDSFKSLRVWSQKQTTPFDNVYKSRLMALCGIHSKMVEKITRSIFNKITASKTELIERLQFLLVIDYKTVLTTIANLLVQRKTTACGQYDAMADDYISAIILTFSGADNAFKTHPIRDPSFKAFFELNTQTIPGANALLSTLCDMCITIGFADCKNICKNKCEDGCKNNCENKRFNLESLASIVGAFAKKHVLIDTYRQFILSCLSEKSIADFANLSNEVRMKMAIRALKQAENLNPEIIMAFKSFPQINGYITHTISILITPTIEKQIVIERKENKETSEIAQLVFFNNMDILNYGDVLEDCCYDLEKKFKQYPTCRKEIIQRVIVCLIEKITNKTIAKLGEIVVQLLELIKKEELKIEAKIIEVECLNDIKIDVPFAGKTFSELWNLLS